MNAKEFLDNKQNEHFERFGVYADVNSKIAEWMEEYATSFSRRQQNDKRGKSIPLQHKAKALTKEEVEANRSNAYKYLDL